MIRTYAVEVRTRVTATHVEDPAGRVEEVTVPPAGDADVETLAMTQAQLQAKYPDDEIVLLSLSAWQARWTSQQSAPAVST